MSPLFCPSCCRKKIQSAASHAATLSLASLHAWKVVFRQWLIWPLDKASFMMNEQAKSKADTLQHCNSPHMLYSVMLPQDIYNQHRKCLRHPGHHTDIPKAKSPTAGSTVGLSAEPELERLHTPDVAFGALAAVGPCVADPALAGAERAQAESMAATRGPPAWRWAGHQRERAVPRAPYGRPHYVRYSNSPTDPIAGNTGPSGFQSMPSFLLCHKPKNPKETWRHFCG